jgi:hypothetical protein
MQNKLKHIHGPPKALKAKCHDYVQEKVSRHKSLH